MKYRLQLSAVLAAGLLCAVPATAQRGPGGPPGGGPGRGPGLGGPPPAGGPPMGGGAPAPGSRSPAGNSTTTTGSPSTGINFGPPGRWWDDKQFARSLGIDSSQQHRMDQVFNGNRDALFFRYTELKKEEAQLSRLTQSASPSEKEVDAQIERVSQARAELAKANAHMVLALRKELTPEQSAKLDSH